MYENTIDNIIRYNSIFYFYKSAWSVVTTDVAIDKNMYDRLPIQVQIPIQNYIIGSYILQNTK